MLKIFSFSVLVLILVSCSISDRQIFNTNSTISIDSDDTKDSIMFKAAQVIPTSNQFKAIKNEFIAFVHFGPNTFTRKEWGNGMEDPKIFKLENLDTDQWCKAMKAAQMKMVILTVKHHDGFVLWQSRYTKHGIMSTNFKNGNGDVLRELSISCQKYGLKLGIYLSPADLYQIERPQGLYGNLSNYSDRVIPKFVPGRPFANKRTFSFNVDDYNEYFLNQLFELLTEYGPIHEVWFDGAHPKRKGGQTYNYLAWKELISSLAPEAVVFGKQDIRWCGNEAGGTRDTEWNVIPYSENPHLMNSFPDITAKDIGSREQLYKSKYLHYQQTETNTSIREGWFYRDDTSQNVRSADDVFDIYERSVGGNSTFLLNIPPNRNGLFSSKDVAVLEEVGKRINETYTTNLFASAIGPKYMLDNNTSTFEVLKSDPKEIVITTKIPVTINRLVLQEAISTYSERVEKHTVDAWINNNWEEIISATNIGYKRILRFPETTSNKFRVRILEYRLHPAISNITAHYYKARLPQLRITRTINGMVSIKYKKHEFGWKSHGEDSTGNLNTELEIRYTTQGSTPTKNSPLYVSPFTLSSGLVKAIVFSKNESGHESSRKLGILKKNWKLLNSDSQSDQHKGSNAFDENDSTYWQSKSNDITHYLSIDLGKTYNLTGFAYTPQSFNSEGMIQQGDVKVSLDGLLWSNFDSFEFGNLINDPETRKHQFKYSISTRYIKIESNQIASGDNSAAIAELDFFEK